MPRRSDAREKRHWRDAQESKSKSKIFFSTPKRFHALTRIESSGAILLLLLDGIAGLLRTARDVIGPVVNRFSQA